MTASPPSADARFEDGHEAALHLAACFEKPVFNLILLI